MTEPTSSTPATTPVDAAPHAWLDLGLVLAHVGVAPGGDQADAVERARVAAAAYVEDARRDVFPPGVRVGAVPDGVKLGAVLLAARWHARRSSPAGLATFADFGATSVPRLDVDVERLLGVGRYARPRIG